MKSSTHPLPSKEDLKAIYRIQQSYTRVTPLLQSSCLSEWIKGQVLIKPESLQVTGAFKFRGAIYRLHTLTPEEKARGVIAYSSGNFARGLAAAGEILGISVHLVMPADAPHIKIKSARAHGAQVVLCQSNLPSREEAASEMAKDIARETGRVLLHPFDDPLIIHGQAGTAIELEQQLSDQQLELDALLCPVGGGSLAAGCSLVFGKGSATQIYSAEPCSYAGLKESIQQTSVTRAPGNLKTGCDALQARSPGAANFDVLSESSIQCLEVGERFIIKAVRLAFQELKLVLEPSGAIGIAALLQEPERFYGKTLVIMATGGNVDASEFSRMISAPASDEACPSKD